MLAPRWWLLTILLLQQMLILCIDGSPHAMNDDEMKFHLHVRVRGDEEVTGVFNTISSYAVELTNSHPTQPLELISIQSDNSEFYFSERNFPAEIMPFKKIEIPFYFLPHVKQDESFLLDEGREDSELGSRFHHSATFQVICDLTFSEFSISGTSSGGFLATTLINSLSEYVSMDGRTINKQLRSLIDPIYPENSYKEVITGSIVHLYAEHPLEEDFYLYDYFSDSQDISVVVFDEIDYEYIFPAINTSERYVASVVINKHPDLGIRGFVYLKSQFGDYVVPINLTDNASSNLVASVEKIDFGVVFADAENEPYTIELYNPTSSALRIRNVSVFADQSSLPIRERGKSPINSSGIPNYVTVDFNNRNVLPGGKSKLTIELLNLANHPNLGIHNVGLVSVETEKSVLNIPYKFTLLQAHNTIGYNVKDIDLTEEMKFLNKQNPKEKVSVTLPLYNGLGIPFKILSVHVSKPCESFVKLKNTFEETYSISPRTAFSLLLELSSATDHPHSTCSIKIKTTIRSYIVPLVTIQPYIMIESDHMSPVRTSEITSTRLIANNDEIIHLYITNHSVKPIVLRYGQGTRVGRIPCQLQSLIDTNSNEISETLSSKELDYVSSNSSFVFEELAWKTDLAPSLPKISEQTYAPHARLLNRIYDRSHVLQYHKAAYESWDGDRKITLPGGGKLRFDISHADEAKYPETMEDGILFENSVFSFSWTQSATVDLNVTVQRITRLEDVRKIFFLLSDNLPGDSTDQLKTFQDDFVQEPLVVTDTSTQVLQLYNAHSESIEGLSPSFVISHPLLNVRGILNESQTLHPQDIRNLAVFEIVKIQGGVWGMMREWIAGMLDVMGYSASTDQNERSSLENLPSIKDISFSCPYNEILILKELYQSLQTFSDHMQRTERENLFPLVEHIRRQYNIIPKYFWTVNGTITVFTEESQPHFSSNDYQSSTYTIPLQYVIELPHLHTNVEFAAAHVGSASLMYIDVANPSDSQIVCSIVDLDKSVLIQTVGGEDPPWWAGGRYWMHTINPHIFRNDGMVVSSKGTGDHLMMSTHNVTLSSQTGAAIHLVNPSLHTTTSFTHSCGARCNLRNEVPTNQANLATIPGGGPVTATWDNGDIKGFVIGASKAMISGSENKFQAKNEVQAFALPITSSKKQIIPPKGTARLGPIVFRPDKVGAAKGRIGISNGWNGLQVVDLHGIGEYEMLSIYEVEFVNIDGRILIQNKNDGETTRIVKFTQGDRIKWLELVNEGTLPVTFAITLADGSCEDHSFVLADCRGRSNTQLEDNPHEDIIQNARKITIPFRDLWEVGEDFVTLQPRQRTLVPIRFNQDCVYNEIWTNLILTHKVPQKFRPSVQRIYVGYVGSSDTKCTPYDTKRFWSWGRGKISLQFISIAVVFIYFAEMRKRYRKRVRNGMSKLTDSQKSVLRCLTCMDPSVPQLLEVSEGLCKSNANRANVKFIESRGAPQIKDLTDALFITANVDFHGTSSIQPLGLNWRAFPKTFQIPKESQVMKVNRSRKIPNKLYDIHEDSDTDNDESAASSEQDVAASDDERENINNDKLLDEQRQVHFKKDTIKESATPNGFKRVGEKKPSAREGKSFIVYNAPKKQPPIQPVKKKHSRLVREKPEKHTQVVPKKMGVDTVTRRSKKVVKKEEEQQQTPSIWEKKSDLKKAHITKKSTASVDKKAKHSKRGNEVTRKTPFEKKKSDSVEDTTLNLKSSDADEGDVHLPPVLPPPPGFPASPKASPPVEKDFSKRIVSPVNISGNNWSGLKPSPSVEFPPLSLPDNEPPVDNINPETYYGQVPGKNYVHRQTSLKSEIDPTVDDSMGQELLPYVGWETFANSSRSDFNVENFLAGVLDEDVPPSTDDNLAINPDFNRSEQGDFILNYLETSLQDDGWHSDSNPHGQVKSLSGWGSGMDLPILSNTRLGESSESRHVAFWSTQTDDEDESGRE